MQDGRTGGTIEVFGCGDGFGPGLASIKVVTDEAVGTEVDVEMFAVCDGSGCGGGIEVVDRFDGDFGGEASPEEATGLSVEREGDEAIGFEGGEEKFVAGDNG